MARSTVREADIQAACIEWLEWHGWHVLRLNSGKALVQGRCIKLCPEGTPDTLAFRPSVHGEGIVQLVFLEFKQPGKMPTVMQQVRMEELRLYGAACYVISSLDQLEEIIRQMGEVSILLREREWPSDARG